MGIASTADGPLVRLGSPCPSPLFTRSHPHPGGGSLLHGERSRTLLLRAIFGISCLLLGAALLLCQGEGSDQLAADALPQAAIHWVRTVDGWERPDSWNLVTAERPALHPVVVAAGQVLLSAFGLVLFQRDVR